MEPPTIAANVPDWFLSSVAALLPRHLAAADLQLSAIAGGGNNRVFRVASHSHAYFVKWYFAAPDDPRDRLLSEWEFANFAWRNGLRNLAEPVACDAVRRVAIFEFIPGRRLTPTEINGSHVRAAIEFLLELNQHRESPDAASLPIASEACFSISSHIDCIRRRVRQLQEGAKEASVSPEARDFIDHVLASAMDRVEASIRQEMERQPTLTELSCEERIVSPSDFGFHNAFLDTNGRLRFFDFEYAGWDDPAKTVCDFFSQVAVPVPREHWSEFVSRITPVGGANVAQRSELLRPLYLVKWCCIVLNPLLQVGRERREFSGGQDCGIAESECVDRARRILGSVLD